ncbi:MAG: NAD-glutamate dehydrogenase domain-containing protein, partial [Ilumatobacteraceae bacterium]
MIGHPGVRRLVAAASERWPDDPDVGSFIEQYFAEIPEFDIDERREDDLVATAVAHLGLGRTRRPGDTLVAVESLGTSGGRRSAVMLVTDDAPFLVDTARLVLERHGIVTHLLVHPMLTVRRRDDGALLGVGPDETDRARSVEAWTFIEIDRVTDERAERLRLELVDAVSSVHRVVADFGPMRSRLERFRDRDPLLGWLVDGNFVFLGAATYRLDADGPSLVDGVGHPATFETVDPPLVGDGEVVSVCRSTRTATIHRRARYTVVSVVDVRDGVGFVERFFGLLAATAYRQSILSIPSIGDRAQAVLGLASRGPETHVGRTMRNVLEALPRDLVFELGTGDLAQLVIDVVGLHERQIVRVFDVPEPGGEMSTVLVFLPRHRFDARVPEEVARRIGERYGSAVRDLESHVGTSSLARITMTVRRPTDPPDLDELSDELDEATTGWIDRVRAAVVEALGADAADGSMTRIAAMAPDSYRTAVDPRLAVVDLVRLADLSADRWTSDVPATVAALAREADAAPGVWRMRVYRRGPALTLADLLPLLALLGFETLDERPHRFEIDGDDHHRYDIHLYDIGVRVAGDADLDDDRASEILAAFSKILAGDLDADGFLRLIALAGLSIRQVDVVRVYARYARQIGFPFSLSYIEDTFASLPEVAAELVALFEGRFDPDLGDGDRLAAVAHAESRILEILDAVPSLDHDRIGRMFLALVRATVRTSAFRGRSTIALKFDPAMVPDLPAPRPAHEIFVSSPRVEGVHLRGGAIARGGIRWSDRPEDYRTEVLGLVKAQMVKNAVIVPVGAKGGFVLKRPPVDPADRRAEAEACYREFIGGLLDLTDDVVDGVVVHPPRTVRYDDDDPYLVVAADKGTATFSDLANGIATERGFWLGDAFASGGSAGYDHKEMGITARGAWESVRRHARMIGKQADRDVLTVVGIGDMSGDVFGNGMLLSPHLALVAAFDHRHVFVDPDPDPATSFAERRRLFELPRSSWADYDTAVLSRGAIVVPRSAKWVELSEEARAVLDITASRMTPNELIRAILRAPVDMLWNGGIGTYVKSVSESHEDVGDRTNDPVRIDGVDLRCRMVVEGGNLGMTQLGRVEYALAGGLVHTDAIDNSAGVDCSDHEVNIKILLASAIAGGDLAREERDELLASMTDEVAS